jgi:hypothetical protein
MRRCSGADTEALRRCEDVKALQPKRGDAEASAESLVADGVTGVACSPAWQ